MKNLFSTAALLLIISITWGQNTNKFVSGKVFDRYDNPLPDVKISIIGSERYAKTDSEGEYSIYAKVTDTLVFTHFEYFPNLSLVGENSAISVFMKPKEQKRKELVEGPLGIKGDPSKITYAYQVITPDELLIGRNPNTVEALEGKVSGLINAHPIPDPKSRPRPKEIYLRGIRTLKGGNSALVVIDGVPSNYEVLETMDNNLIHSITIIKGANGAALYGSSGSNGVIIVKTKTTFSKSNEKNINDEKKKYRDNRFRYTKRLKVNYEEEVPVHIQAFKNCNSIDQAFKLYTTEKEAFKNNPSYFIDAFSYFKENKTYSSVVVEDILNLENIKPITLKGIALKLEEINDKVFIKEIYSKLISELSNDAKVFRSMAHVYNNEGNNTVALNTFNLLTDRELMIEKGIDNSKEISPIVIHELNNLLQMNTDLDKDNVDGYKIVNTTFDLRIVMETNRDDVDINLSLINPYLEICSEENPKTRIGEEMIFTEGLYEYTLRNARKGSYYIKADYSNEYAATFLKITIYKNYGKPNVSKEVKVFRLSEKKENQILYKLDY